MQYLAESTTNQAIQEITKKIYVIYILLSIKFQFNYQLYSYYTRRKDNLAFILQLFYSSRALSILSRFFRDHLDGKY